METTKSTGIFLYGTDSITSKVNQQNEILLEQIIKKNDNKMIIYLFGKQQELLVCIPSLYTVIWDLLLTYNKPNIEFIVYPIVNNSSLPESESLVKIYSLKENKENIETIIKNNISHYEAIDCEFIDLDLWNDLCIPLDFNNATELHYNNICLGGTFDCLHAGHKILLTLACLVSNHIVIGVTSQDMLATKSNADKIKSYEERCQLVNAFCHQVNPNIELQLEPLHDIYGPAIIFKDLDAIIVSLETFKGGIMINEVRKQKGMKPLVVLTVNRSSKYILSSTFIRKTLE
ncbi:hypothetical protein WA158_006373 [Blastocystis sp. Blastoise]